MLCDTLLSDIRKEILSVSPDLDRRAAVSALCEQADDTRPGSLYVCVRGIHADGHDGIPKAVRNGASLVLLDRAEICACCPVPWVLVRDTRACLLPLYLSFAGHPERAMRFCAVTGTNGKTSVTYLSEAIFEARERCAVLGTVENRIAGTVFPADMTTPAPAKLAAFLRKAADARVTRVLLEASSHALAQKRLAGLSFECGVFTNLTEDHLDYHKTWEDYYSCKRSLFSACTSGAVNADDLSGRQLLCDPEFSGHLHGFSVGGNAEYACSDIRTGADGSDFRFSSPEGSASVHLPLCGGFMISNAAAALTSAVLCGVPLPEAAAALASCRPVPGRMERIVSEPFSVYLDYAHTPDALSRALETLRAETKGRLLLLFGCGGDREREKRPRMGALAAEYADFFLVTDDNPRTENPEDIRRDIRAGIPAGTAYAEIPGRETAIRLLLAKAGPGDTVLLAGKGHENYTIDRTGKHPFSEREIVRDALSVLTMERTMKSDENTV